MTGTTTSMCGGNSAKWWWAWHSQVGWVPAETFIKTRMVGKKKKKKKRKKRKRKPRSLGCFWSLGGPRPLLGYCLSLPTTLTCTHSILNTSLCQHLETASRYSVHTLALRHPQRLAGDCYGAGGRAPYLPYCHRSHRDSPNSDWTRRQVVASTSKASRCPKPLEHPYCPVVVR
jgi:hypothetical protein